MGNCTVTGNNNTAGCSLRGTAAVCSSAHRAAAAVAPRRAADRVRVMTDAGRVVEFDGPVQAGDVLTGFPQHGVFRQGDVSFPLLRHEQLHGGRLYYLLPLDRKAAASGQEGDGPLRRAASYRAEPSPALAGNLEVLPPPMKGVWRIKLVISAEELAGILAEQGNTEALIERMRMLASGAEAMAAQGKQQGASLRKAPVALPALSQAHHACERM